MTLELGMSREDRRPADEMSSWAAKEYDRMQQDAPPVGGPVVAAFRKKFGGSKQSIPDVAETEFLINVQGRSIDDIDA